MSVWRNFHHWLYRKFSNWQLLVKTVKKTSSEWGQIRSNIFIILINFSSLATPEVVKMTTSGQNGNLYYSHWCKYPQHDDISVSVLASQIVTALKLKGRYIDDLFVIGCTWGCQRGCQNDNLEWSADSDEKFVRRLGFQLIGIPYSSPVRAAYGLSVFQFKIWAGI